MNHGKKFRNLLQNDKPLQIAGTINAYTALLAKHAGFSAIYLSGAGVANASLGLPDLGITSREDVLIDAKRITSAVDLPLLVDIDTGWGDYFNIARTIKDMISANVSAIHIEDQLTSKRCGHRPNKQLTSTANMVNRIHAAVDARYDHEFVIMARTDALATEGINACIDRIMHYVEAGADMIFFEGANTLEEYQQITKTCKVPVLANITEFGKTPLFTLEELKQAGISLVLYPLSAFRAMNKTALSVYQTIHQDGSQKNSLPLMQTRDELYQTLDYLKYEKRMDEILKKEQTDE